MLQVADRQVAEDDNFVRAGDTEYSLRFSVEMPRYKTDVEVRGRNMKESRREWGIEKVVVELCGMRG